VRKQTEDFLMAKQSKATTEASKSTEAPKSKFRKKTDGVITLSDLCKELKHDPKLARAKLRAAVKDAKTYPALGKSHTARKAWEWGKDSPALAEARKVIAS
jgi:hypothetical protein